nr:zinc finger, CCHC-type, retrotransposon Gag domain protein [Tanacetum cinerariifolium]
SQQSRGSSEGYSYPVCTTYGRRHPGECRRAAGTCFKCGQAGHLQKDCKKNTTASTSGQADKKPGASGRVFAITEGHAAMTSAEQERLKREYQSIRQTDTKTSTEFMHHFLRLAGFLGAAAGTAEEQAKNFQWGLRKSTLNHLMCIPFTDVAQVANAARNYEILHERDDDGAERPDK